MTETMPELDVDAANRAYAKFRQLMNIAANKNSARLYYRFLGYKKDKNASFSDMWEGVAFTQQANDRVRWLLSDNAKTMFRIWLAQNEDAL